MGTQESLVREFAKDYAKIKRLSPQEAAEKLDALWAKAYRTAVNSGKFDREDSNFHAYVAGVWKRLSGYKAFMKKQAVKAKVATVPQAPRKPSLVRPSAPVVHEKPTQLALSF